MIRFTGKQPEEPLTFVIHEESDPVERARTQAQHERFRRNMGWCEAHAREIGEKYRGKCICIAGEELFAADTAEEVLAWAKAVHPEDDGLFIQYIRRETGPRIYSCRRPARFTDL